jgi:hypothetical protein
MYKGVSSKGIEFYNLLFNNIEFCAELGKITLASGKLEVELILLLTRKNIDENLVKATLGRLIRIAKNNHLLGDNLIMSLELILKQRNYLTHNIYALFSETITETILERENLLDSDIITYVEIVKDLKENLLHLSKVISEI